MPQGWVVAAALGRRCRTYLSEVAVLRLAIAMR